MKRKPANRGYIPPMTDSEVLELLEFGTYRVDRFTGDVFNIKGRRVKHYIADYIIYVKLYKTEMGRLKHRSISLAKLLWISVTRTLVPKGFEIHHRDGDKTNTVWDNLLCVHAMDHKKLHGVSDTVPF